MDYSKVFKELSNIITKMFAFLLLSLIFKGTKTGQHLFQTHPFVMDFVFIICLLYFLLSILRTVLQPRLARGHDV